MAGAVRRREPEKHKGGAMAGAIFVAIVLIAGFILVSKGTISLPSSTADSLVTAKEEAKPKRVPNGTKKCQLPNKQRNEACKKAKSYAQTKVKGGNAEYACLDKLWEGESNWSAWAVNPSSGAYGIPQVLPSVHGRPYAMGDWRKQVDWGLNYINGRYGTPCAAWRFWQKQSPHWY